MFFDDPSSAAGEFLRESEEQRIRRQELRLRQNQAAAIGRLVSEVEALRKDLAATKEELADYKAQQAKQRDSDSVQAELDRNKVFRHEYRVAGLTILLTFLSERLCDLAQLDEVLLKWFASLFQ